MKGFAISLVGMVSLANVLAENIKIESDAIKNGSLSLVSVDLKKEDQAIDSIKLSALNKDLPLIPQSKDKAFAFLVVPHIQAPTETFLKVMDNSNGKITKYPFKVIDGGYKREKLIVDPSKVKLSDIDQKRVDIESAQLGDIYSSFARDILYANKPFIPPLKSKITSNFGSMRIFNGVMNSYHSGTDYRAPMRTPIVAAQSGRVVIARDLFFAGNCIVLDHGYKVYTSYSHLETILVKEGDVVNQGSKLGLSGTTGRSNAPHLHFGVKVNEVSVDPQAFLKLTKSFVNSERPLKYASQKKTTNF